MIALTVQQFSDIAAPLLPLVCILWIVAHVFLMNTVIKSAKHIKK